MDCLSPSLSPGGNVTGFLMLVHSHGSSIGGGTGGHTLAGLTVPSLGTAVIIGIHSGKGDDVGGKILVKFTFFIDYNYRKINKLRKFEESL